MTHADIQPDLPPPPPAPLPARGPHGTFRPGFSGNPMGRPRAVALAQPAPRRLIPAEPTELELALAEPVICPSADASGPVSLARAVLARLTERALTFGDVPACRELLRLCAEAEAVRTERAQLVAERAAAEAARAAAAEDEARRAAARAAEAVQAAALEALDQLVQDAADDAGQDGMDNDDRALLLLDAAEPDARGRPARLKAWVAEAARAHDPALPRGPADQPPELDDLVGAKDRLDLQRFDSECEPSLAAWFIDAARARRPDHRFTPGEEALLARVRVEEGEESPDWAGRLAAWMEGARGEPGRA